MTLSIIVVGERGNWRKSRRVTDRCQLDRAWKHPRAIERNGTRGQWPRLCYIGRLVATLETREVEIGRHMRREDDDGIDCYDEVDDLDGFTPGAGSIEISGTMFVPWKEGGE